MAELLPDDVYAVQTPKKRIAASLLCLDTEQRILIVKPTYRPDWLLPGGITEKDEGPSMTAQRESAEELGMALTPQRLLCAVWRQTARLPGDQINFIFDGGTLTQPQIAQIVLPSDELSEYRFVTLAEAAILLPAILVTGVRAALQALSLNHPIYVEEDRFF